MKRLARPVFYATAMLIWACHLPEIQAQTTYEWAGSSGNWSTAANWNTPPGAPPSNTDTIVALKNGTPLAPATTTFTAPTTAQSLSIGANNRLEFTGAVSGTVRLAIQSGTSGPGAFHNAGTISVQNTSGIYHLRVAGLSKSNSGIIEASGIGGIFWLNTGNGSDNENQSFDNTGGIIRANSGAHLQIESGAAGNTESKSEIIGGSLIGEAGSTILVTKSNVALRLRDLTVTNAGTMEVSHDNFANNDRTTLISLSGSTTMSNIGLVHVLNNGSGTNDIFKKRLTNFEVKGTASFNNQGTIRVESTTTATGSLADTQSAEFLINSSTATFTNTGTIEVFHNTTQANTLTRFSSVKSITNAGQVHLRGNTLNAGASLVVSGAGNRYTQNGGANSSTILESGAELSAALVKIESGKLGGSGTITGATTISSGATLAPGIKTDQTFAAGALQFNGNLTLADGANAMLQLGTDTAGSSRVTLGGASTLTIEQNVILTIQFIDTASIGTVYHLFTLNTGLIIGGFSLENIILPDGYQGILTGGNGNSYLNFQVLAIPEPRTWILLCFQALVIVHWRRGSSRM